MVLNKEYIEEEVKKTKIVIEKCQEGLDVNTLILKSFEDALKSFS